MFPTIENWTIYKGAIVGNVYNHPVFEDGTRIIFGFRLLNLTINQVETANNRIYNLGKSASSDDTICAKVDDIESFKDKMI